MDIDDAVQYKVTAEVDGLERVEYGKREVEPGCFRGIINHHSF